MPSGPYGPHTQALTGDAKRTISAQRNGRILKLVSPITLDRELLSQYRVHNPNALLVYRHYFGDNNLGDVEGRARAIIEAVTPVADLIDVCETGYNECNEGINDGIRDLAAAEIAIANKIRQDVHGMKVAGGCFSVGTPYNDVTKGQFQDLEAYAGAFSHLDYWAPHEYGNPSLGAGIEWRNGMPYGSLVLRYRHVVDWAARSGVQLPKIYIGEFGLDAGGAGKGFRSMGVDADNYMNQMRKMAPHFMQDIAAGILVGVAVFCVGQQDERSWGSFDLAGIDVFEEILNESFPMPRKDPPIPTIPDPSVTYRPAPEPVKDDVAQVTHSAYEPEWVPTELLVLYNEWRNTPGNTWPVGTSVERQEFFAHARREGAASSLLPPTASKQEQTTADNLGVPVANVKAVHAIESNGKPFGSFGVETHATIRTEYHVIMHHVPEDKHEWWDQNFRVVAGIEQVWSGEEWENAQKTLQGDRWNDLELAVTIVGDLATDWTSMGLFQILGIHHAALGYDNSRDMLQAFSEDELSQWDGFEAFIRAHRGIHQAMRDSDAATFARLYNGQVEPYAGLLIDAGWGR